MHLQLNTLKSLNRNFIHSFILNIYIAPLQENYSEALPRAPMMKVMTCVDAIASEAEQCSRPEYRQHIAGITQSKRHSSKLGSVLCLLLIQADRPHTF